MDLTARSYFSTLSFQYFFILFFSVVYLNLFLINVVVPLAIYLCLSSVSFLNSSTFLHFNLVFFLIPFHAKIVFFFSLCYRLIYINPRNCFCALPLFPCEILMRVFFCFHHHPPPLQQTLNLLNKH